MIRVRDYSMWYVSGEAEMEIGFDFFEDSRDGLKIGFAGEHVRLMYLVGMTVSLKVQRFKSNPRGFMPAVFLFRSEDHAVTF